MALVSGGRLSSLNPNAPLYIPSAVRQVEDFSPEWWNLVTTSTWFKSYWLSQQQEDDNFGEEDVVGLLPDNIDVGMDEDTLNMEAQFEEFLQATQYGGNKGNDGYVNNVNALVKSLNSPKRGVKCMVEQPRHWEKPAKHVSPKCSPRFIQQPR